MSQTPEVKSPDQEAFIEIAYKRGYNMGPRYGEVKEYNLKIAGNQSIVEDQIKNHRARLTKYVKEIESLIEDAHKANLDKAAADAALAAQAAQAQAEVQAQ